MKQRKKWSNLEKIKCLDEKYWILLYGILPLLLNDISCSCDFRKKCFWVIIKFASLSKFAFLRVSSLFLIEHISGWRWSKQHYQQPANAAKKNKKRREGNKPVLKCLFWAENRKATGKGSFFFSCKIALFLFVRRKEIEQTNRVKSRRQFEHLLCKYCQRLTQQTECKSNL